MMPNRIAIKLTQKGEKALKSEHPWIFESSIAQVSKEASAGDLAIVFGKKKNQFLGFGLYDPQSPIRIKMLQFRDRANFDQAFIQRKINAAYQIRKPLLATDTNSYRLVFGENDGLPSLIIDIYDTVAVVKIYSMIWQPYLDWISISLENQNIASTAILRLSRNVMKHSSLEEGTILFGKIDNYEVVFREYGLRFKAHVLKGHKTGYFLDHRANRKEVGLLARGKTILDVFSYAGGFSVHALCGGAKEVTSVDISQQALQLAISNAALNGEYNNHKTLCGDAFNILAQLKDQKTSYDLVIIDPPALAKSAAEVHRAKQSYTRLLKFGIALIAKNGILLMASCSSRISKEDLKLLCESELLLSRRKYTLIKESQHDIDHPIGFPEGAYLKSFFYRLDC